MNRSKDSLYCTMTRLWAGQGGVRIPACEKDLAFPHKVQTGPRSCLASYSKGTGTSWPGSKATGTWDEPIITIQCQG